MRARLASAPLSGIAQRVEGHKVLDAGCGHGVLTALLAHRRPERTVVGVDPDPKKVRWARASVGQMPNVRLQLGAVSELPAAERGTFEAVVVVDVLYLLPRGQWATFLSACRDLLGAGGLLYLKEAEDDGGWRTAKTLFQERLMVHLLRRTKASGAIGFWPRQATVEALRHSGFQVREVVPLSRGYSTPHVLFVAECATR